MKKLILLYVFTFAIQLHAQDTPTPSPIIFIYDASGSMWDQIDGKSKMEIAAGVLINSVNNLPDNQKIGLVAYGHRKEGDCQDVEFLVDVESGTKSLVNQSLSTIKPLGKTPLAYSVMQVIDKLRNAGMKATVILVTDGNESCEGNICDVVNAAKKEGIDFRLHIIGFGLKDGDTEQLKCAASAGDGEYYDAADAGGLGNVLTQATNTTVDESAGNLSVYTIKNGQPIDAQVKVLISGTKTSVKAKRTYGDTAFIFLPAGTYDLEVLPLENSDVSAMLVQGIQTFDDKVTHQNVSFDGAKLSINTLNNGVAWDAVVSIISKETGKSVSGGRTYGKQTEYDIDPGMYNVELKAMVIDGVANKVVLENVEVKANEVKNVEHNFQSGIVMIGANSSSGLVDATVSIIDVNTKKSISGGRTYQTSDSNPKEYLLSPGTYEVILKALKEHQGKSETFTIDVKAGETLNKITNF